MIGPQKPFVDLSVAGSPAGFLLGSNLKSFSYRDVHHGEVDDISFELSDGQGLWRSSWGIDEGTEISATMGYAGLFGDKMPCGLYAVDQPEVSGDGNGDVAKFKCLAAFTSKELRTDRSAAYDQMSLKAIISRVAGRNGMKLLGEVPDLSFERISQSKESDLAFVTRLAEDWGCFASFKGDQLVFTTRESIENAPPVRRLDLSPGDRMTRYTLRRSTHKLYQTAEARYLNPKTKKVLKAEARDDRVLSGDCLKIDDRCESQAHAERRCQARLMKENDGLGTGRISLVGDPLLVAGQVIELGLNFGRYAGRWLVTEGNHRFNSSGYTTSLAIKEI